MASANILQSYLIKLGVSVDKRGLEGFVNTVTKALSGMAKMGAAAVGAFGVVQAGVTKLASSEAELNYLSRRLDMTVESIERLGYVASQSDSSAQAMQASLEGLRRTAGNAASGMARAQRVFEDINVSITDTNGNIKGTEQLFKDVGAALAGMDRGQQASILQRLGMDKTVLRTLIENTQELQEEFDKMAQASGVDFKRAAEAGNELMDELGKMGEFTRLTTKALGTGLMEEFRDGVRRTRKWIVENIDLVKGAVESAVKVIKIGASISGRAVKRFGQTLVWLHEKTSGLSTVLLGLAAVMTLISSPVLIAAGLISGLFLVIDDLWTALEDGKTYFDWSPWLEDIRAIGEGIKDAAKYLDGLAQKMGGWINLTKKAVKYWLIWRGIKIAQHFHLIGNAISFSGKAMSLFGSVARGAMNILRQGILTSTISGMKRLAIATIGGAKSLALFAWNAGVSAVRGLIAFSVAASKTAVRAMLSFVSAVWAGVRADAALLKSLVLTTGRGIAGFVGAIASKMIPVLLGMSAALWAGTIAAMKFAVALLLNPITWIVAGIIALGVAIYYCIKHWDKISEVASKACETMKSVLKNAADFIRAKFSEAFGAVANEVKGVIKAIEDAINWMGRLLGLSEKKADSPELSPEEVLESQGLTPAHRQHAAKRDNEQSFDYTAMSEEAAQKVAAWQLRPTSIDENMLKVHGALPSHINPLMLDQAKNSETVNNNSSGDVNQSIDITVNAYGANGQEIASATEGAARKAAQDMPRYYPRR